MMEKVILFGAGYNYRQHREEYEKQYNVVGVVDNQYEECWEGIYPVSFINETEYDYILITPNKYEDIYEQLIGMGVSPSKIKVMILEHPELWASEILGNRYFGQHADDLVIEAVFARIGIEKPSYMDLGANHPFNNSNTAALYLHGCRGINIEANPVMMRIIKAARPEDINLNIGISVKEGVLPFYMFDCDGINTFSKSEAEKMGGGHKINEIIELPVNTLKKITDEYCPDGFPDFLDCDIEGLDYAVLEDYDLASNGPKVLCVEVRPDEIENFDKMLDKKAYFRFCRIGENNIYVQKKYGPAVCHCEFA